MSILKALPPPLAPCANVIGPVKLSILVSTAASIVAIVVASKASILLKVAVPEESVRIFVPAMEIPLLASR